MTDPHAREYIPFYDYWARKLFILFYIERTED